MEQTFFIKIILNDPSLDNRNSDAGRSWERSVLSGVSQKEEHLVSTYGKVTYSEMSSQGPQRGEWRESKGKE